MATTTSRSSNCKSKWVKRVWEVSMLKRVMKHWKSTMSMLINHKIKSLPSHPSLSPVLSRRQNIPSGFLPVYVGPNRKRFLIPTGFLNLPIFIALLQKSEEEYGFQFNGGIALPCEVDFFEQVLKLLDEDEIKHGNLVVNEFLKAVSDQVASSNKHQNNLSSVHDGLKARACMPCALIN